MVVLWYYATSDKVTLTVLEHFMSHFLPVRFNRNLSAVNTMSESTIKNIRCSISQSTVKHYKSDLNHFHDWLIKTGRSEQLPHPVETIADYISYLDDSDFRMKTIERRIQAISWIHRMNDYHLPPTKHEVVRVVLQGIRRRRAEDGRSATARSKQPITVEMLQHMVDQCDQSNIRGTRDRSLLLMCFSSALRRSELMSLKVDDVMITSKGADITVRRSKTDQTGEGEMVCITRSGSDYCPVSALIKWLTESGVNDGYIFRRISSADNVLKHGLSLDGKTLANKVKEYAKKAGYNPAAVSGHSLRSGMLTSAAENGADLIPLAQHARHKNVSQTMHYIRKANRYKNNPTDGLL